MTSVSRDKISSCSCGFIQFKKAKLVVYLRGIRAAPEHLPADECLPTPLRDLDRADQNTGQNSEQVLQDLHYNSPFFW